MIGRDQQLVVRDKTRRAMDDVRVPRAAPLQRGARSRRRDESSSAHARQDAEQEEPQEHCQLVCVAEAPQVRRQLGRARKELVAGRKPLWIRSRS